MEQNSYYITEICIVFENYLLLVNYLLLIIIGQIHSEVIWNGYKGEHLSFLFISYNR